MLTGLIRAGIKFTFKAATDLSNKREDNNFPAEIAFGDGIGANQADQVFADSRNILAATTDTIDLSGVLKDAFGDTLIMVQITAMYIKAKASNVGDIIVGGASPNGFLGPFQDATDKIALAPGEVFLMTNLKSASGWAVTAGTADLLDIENPDGSNAVDYDIILLARSA